MVKGYRWITESVQSMPCMRYSGVRLKEIKITSKRIRHGPAKGKGTLMQMQPHVESKRTEGGWDY